MDEVTHPPATQQNTPSEGPSLVTLLRALRKRWILSVCIAVAVTLAVGFYTLSQTKIYRAATTIQIDPTSPMPLGREVQSVVDVGGAYWTNKEYFETQFHVIRSRRVAEMTVRSLGLNHNRAFVDNLPPGAAPRAGEVSVESAAQAVRSRLLVEPQKGSRLVTISFEDADPQRATRILSTLVDLYIQQNLNDAIAATGSAGDWLRVQLEKLKGELEGGELDLHKYKKDKGILSVSLDDQSNMLRGEMVLLNSELTKARTRREELLARLKELKRVNPEEPSDVPVSELLQNPVLTELRSQYLVSKRELGTLQAVGRGEAHPEVRAVMSRLSLTRGALVAELRSIQGAAERDVTTIDSQIRGLSGLFERAKGQALDLNLLEIEYKRLARTRDNTEKLYGLVLERSKESDLTGMMRFNNVRMVDAATVPRAPERPRVPTSLALGLVAGIVLGFGAAIAAELLDRTVKSPEDLEREIGFPFLGLLPSIQGLLPPARRGRKLVPDNGRPVELLAQYEPTSGFAEATRAMRTNILFMSPDKPHRRILVTSAGPAEGKTTVACSIAVAMAQAGQRVLLIDCDLRRPRLHRVFSKSGDVGLTTLLIGEESFESLDVATEVPNLFVLTCGPIAPSPAELLHSEKFARLLDELSSRFDRVILDSPPLVPVTDPAILSTQVDGTILVVRALVTSRDLVRQASRALRDVNASIIGVVLNAVDFSKGGHYGYYKYYAYKKEGYGRPESDVRLSA